MQLTEKQKRERRKRYKNATAAEKSNYAKYQKENYKNIAATFRKDEAERIAEIFKAHGVKLSEVLRGAAAALLDGESIRTESAPLAIPAEAGEGQNAPEASEDGETDGGEE